MVFGAVDAAEEEGAGGGVTGVEEEAVGVGVDSAGGNHEFGDGRVLEFAVVDALFAGAVGEAPDAVWKCVSCWFGGRMLITYPALWWQRRGSFVRLSGRHH